MQDAAYMTASGVPSPAAHASHGGLKRLGAMSHPGPQRIPLALADCMVGLSSSQLWFDVQETGVVVTSGDLLPFEEDCCMPMVVVLRVASHRRAGIVYILLQVVDVPSLFLLALVGMNSTLIVGRHCAPGESLNCASDDDALSAIFLLGGVVEMHRLRPCHYPAENQKFSLLDWGNKSGFSVAILLRTLPWILC